MGKIFSIFRNLLYTRDVPGVDLDTKDEGKSLNAEGTVDVKKELRFSVGFQGLWMKWGKI